MEKEISVGDVAIIQKCKGDDVNVGDIIEYQMEGYTVIHRIIEKKQENGEFHFVTKGDNNEKDDAEIVTTDMIIGRVVYTLPSFLLVFKNNYLDYQPFLFPCKSTIPSSIAFKLSSLNIPFK